ncbi:MAG: disulfide bond formation protein B [Ilumatobacteraceae bacterium]
MPTTTVQTFTALLTVMVIAFTAVVIGCRVVAGRSATATAVLDAIAPIADGLGAAIAAGCMAGSLYFSEVAHYLPCTLCWYQRIAMYPLAVILTIAAFRRDHGMRLYVVAIAALGAMVSTYHWFLERFPSLDSGACSASIPCEFIWFEKFGFVTLPLMAFTGFAAIINLVTLDRPRNAAFNEEI